MRCFELCMKINTSFSWGCEKSGERCASAAASSEPFRASNIPRPLLGSVGGGEHAYLEARFQFLVRLGHLLGQHLLADDVRSAHDDLVRH